MDQNDTGHGPSHPYPAGVNAHWKNLGRPIGLRTRVTFIWICSISRERDEWKGRWDRISEPKRSIQQKDKPRIESDDLTGDGQARIR